MNGQKREQLRQLLLRIAGDGNGGISEQRLEEWLCRNCNRSARMGDGRKYQLIRGVDQKGRPTFQLSRIEDEPALTVTEDEWRDMWSGKYLR
jgi:hypothetical protein